MFRKTYVRDPRFTERYAKFKKRLAAVLKAAAAAALSAALLAAAGYGIVSLTSLRIQKQYDRFTEDCDRGDYSAAIAVYRNIHEIVLADSAWRFNRQVFRSIMLRIEDRIDAMLAVPFTALTRNQRPLSGTEQKMLNDFGEVTVMKMSRLIDSYLKDFIMGKEEESHVAFTFAELKKVEPVADLAALYEPQIPAIGGFSQTMIRIDAMRADRSYTDAIRLVSDEEGKQSGFVREYLSSYLKSLKEEAYPILLGEIDVMMSRGKYYSARSLLEEVMPFFPSDADLEASNNTCKEHTSQKLTLYTKPVEHIAVRPLISTPGFRFDRDEYAKTAEDLMLTAGEFSRILQELYANGYVLIDIESLTDAKGIYAPIKVPEGKKPLILSIEGLNYYASRRLTGNSFNLALDGQGNVVSEYAGADGRTVTDRNGEAIGILEQFVEKHPDFSFDGARGNISLTGFECIFGYVTEEDQVDDRSSQYLALGLGNFSITGAQIDENRKAALGVIEALAAGGWTFSSSTYGNITVSDATLVQVQADTEKWKAQVGKLVGAARVLLFPNGGVVGSKDPRGAFLIGEGFVIQCGIGPTAYFNAGTQDLFMDRIALNGYALRHYDLSRFFDVRKVYDPSRTKTLP